MECESSESSSGQTPGKSGPCARCHISHSFSSFDTTYHHIAGVEERHLRLRCSFAPCQVYVRGGSWGVVAANTLDTEELPNFQCCATHPREYEAHQICLDHHERGSSSGRGVQKLRHNRGMLRGLRSCTMSLKDRAGK
jgi:hypothetical protein